MAKAIVFFDLFSGKLQHYTSHRSKGGWGEIQLTKPVELFDAGKLLLGWNNEQHRMKGFGWNKSLHKTKARR